LLTTLLLKHTTFTLLAQKARLFLALLLDTQDISERDLIFFAVLGEPHAAFGGGWLSFGQMRRDGRGTLSVGVGSERDGRRLSARRAVLFAQG
jgi:hypothetical protein